MTEAENLLHGDRRKAKKTGAKAGNTSDLVNTIFSIIIRWGKSLSTVPHRWASGLYLGTSTPLLTVSRGAVCCPSPRRGVPSQEATPETRQHKSSL